MNTFEQGDFKIAVIVDMQEDFMDKEGAALPVPGATDDFINNVNEYLETLTLENGYMAVVLTADTHDPETYPDSHEAKGDPEKNIPGFVPHCYMGTDGFKFSVNPKLVPNDNGTKRFILNKGVFDMWQETNIIVRPYKVEGEFVSYACEYPRDIFFKRFVTLGVEDVEVVGVASDYCVKWAIRGLVNRGFRVTTFDDLTAGIGKSIREVVEEEFGRDLVQVF